MTTAHLARAQEIVEKLPHNACWSFHITDLEDDAVFNIYAPRHLWHGFRVLLQLGQAEFRYDGLGESTEEYNLDGLTLSINTPEEQDEPTDPA